MPGDRSWMNHKGINDRRKPEYIEGVNEFLEFCFGGKEEGILLKCPCLNCNFILAQNQRTMWIHLMMYGIKNDYNPWIFHGESDGSSIRGDNNSIHNTYDEETRVNADDEADLDNMGPLVQDVTNVQFSMGIDSIESEVGCQSLEENDVGLEKFFKLMKDAETELYAGCKTFSKLEFLVNLLHIKVSNKWSNKSFDMLLQVLHRAFNFDKGFPKTSYEARKYTKELGLNYVKIDACINHCILFWKEYSQYNSCPVCGCSRWKDKNQDDGSSSDDNGLHMRNKVPQLVLRHFPLIPRLQRMYRCSKLAEHMRWHKEHRPDDGIMRHPADSKAWKFLDELFPTFSADPRSVRLALASDGFNPGAHLSSKYSIWPVILVPYNLPPWMCMKSAYFMLSLLIPGPKSPGNDIDVFLQPLIEELKELWENGVRTFDAHTGEVFNMHAVLMWTISDFPAYANLSGWSTKGTLACPNCHKDTCSQRLKHSRKHCYLGHRRFLEPDHKWRLNRKDFGVGHTERGPPPKSLSGHDILEELSGVINVTFGKSKSFKRKRSERYLVHQWKKKSIFFELPYWKHLLIRHNLDVMHVEKNICDNILGTLLDIPGKNKDTLNARLDLENMKMHPHLRPKLVGEKFHIPKASYSLTLFERREVAALLANLAIPDGYSSNISRCVSLEDGRISGMKSHDCHVFMQDLLLPAFRGVLDDKVLQPLVELSRYLKQLCSKTLKIDVLEQMERDIAITLCKLERLFVPSFFDVMVHLTVHLASEAKLAGPVAYRSMWRFEREMRTYKSFVGNKACPEGSIAESEIADECLTFCSRYLSKIETQFNREERNDDENHPLPYSLSIFCKYGKPLGKATLKELSFKDWEQAQLYILRNCSEVQPFYELMASNLSSSQAMVHLNQETSPDAHDERSDNLANPMTYRQRRRLQQSQRTGPKRGSTRGKKYFNSRLNDHTTKPYAKITEEMNRIVGTDANQFITELGVWVKNYCPLDSRNWKYMDPTAKERLFNKIKAEWTLPEGSHVDKALSMQCQILYRQWRFRLKERYFNGFSTSQAIANRPQTINATVWRWLVVDFWGSSKQKHISEVNRRNKSRQIEIPRNGGKSTARYLHEIEHQPSKEPSILAENADESIEEPEQEPDYIRLWEKTKRKKDGTWEDGAYAKYQKLTELHAKQKELYGVDNLSVKEAYTQAFEHRSGYIRGLGAGPMPLRNKKDNEIEASLRQQIEELKHSNALREENLRLEMEKMKEIAEERERKLREEAEERERKLRADADEATQKLKAEMMQVVRDQIASFLGTQQSSQLTKLV